MGSDDWECWEPPDWGWDDLVPDWGARTLPDWDYETLAADWGWDDPGDDPGEKLTKCTEGAG